MKRYGPDFLRRTCSPITLRDIDRPLNLLREVHGDLCPIIAPVAADCLRTCRYCCSVIRTDRLDAASRPDPTLERVVRDGIGHVLTPERQGRDGSLAVS